MARTLTTVAQYACFVDSGSAYTKAFEGDGAAWLKDMYDSKITDKDIKKWLAQRHIGQRSSPDYWQEQLANRLRPVVHVS